MTTEEKVKHLNVILREKEIPFFPDDEIKFHLEDNGGDLNRTAHRLLLIKANNSELGLSGLTLPDSSKYFRRLAAKYRPLNSGYLRGT